MRRPEVDRRIEFDPTLPSLLNVQVEAPQVGLAQPTFQQDAFPVGVQLPAERHDAAGNVHHSLDHIAELLFREGGQV